MIANTTISKIGVKTVSIRTFGNDRSRFAYVLDLMVKKSLF